MKQKEKKILSLICMSAVLTLLATGCVQICYESPGRIKRAAKYTSQIPITVKDLKSKVDSDTSQYKILIYYNYCCGACTKRFNDTYYRLWHEMDSSLVSWYFVQSDCSGVKWNEQFLRNYGINTTMYYIRDDSPEYLSYEGNFTNCFFGRHITDESTGTPTTYILDRNGTLKLAHYTYSDGSSSTEPLELHHLSIPLEQVDFHAIDTLVYSF